MFGKVRWAGGAFCGALRAVPELMHVVREGTGLSRRPWTFFRVWELPLGDAAGNGEQGSHL